MYVALNVGCDKTNVYIAMYVRLDDGTLHVAICA